MLVTKQIQFPWEVNEKFTPSLGRTGDGRRKTERRFWAILGRFLGEKWVLVKVWKFKEVVDIYFDKKVAMYGSAKVNRL